VKNLILDNLGLKISAVLISVFLWFFVASRGQSEISFEAPLEFRNIPAELGITSTGPNTVMLTVRGQERSVKSLNAAEVRVVIDMSRAKQGEELYHINKDDVKLPFAISVTNVSPASVRVRLEEMFTKTLPVQARLSGVPEKGVVTAVAVEPKEVRVRGLKSEIRKLRALRTEEFDVSDLTETVTEELNIDTSGMNLMPEVSKVKVKIMIAEKKT
jgi:YbbR domain-containing protein